MARTRRTAMLALVASVAVACTGPQDLPGQPAEVPADSPVAGVAPVPTGSVSGTGVDDVRNADPVASGEASSGGSTPAGTDDPTPHDRADGASGPSKAEQLPAAVEVLQPDYVITAGTELDDEQLAQLEQLDELRHVAPVARHQAQLSGPDADVEDSVMVVDPLRFRPLTPEVTAQAVGVWERLAAGEVVVRHDIANTLGLELGGNLLLATDEGSRVARVGAFAANGTPPVAAVLVPWSVARELGIERPNGLVVAADEDEVEDAPAAIRGLLAEATIDRQRVPEQQTASTGGPSRLEPFDYTDLGDGTIIIDPAWVARHIRTVEIPGIATTRCHELMIPQLLAALDEIRAAGLYDHFKPEQFGGCWVARHIDWDPSKPLSNHAWGTAIDFNTHDNWLGESPQMDRRIVEIFEKWGFEWGGHWRRPDGMHFELDRIVRPAGG